jgi:hypothetical protein
LSLQGATLQNSVQKLTGCETRTDSGLGGDFPFLRLKREKRDFGRHLGGMLTLVLTAALGKSS